MMKIIRTYNIQSSFSARKTLEAKPDSVSIFCDSEFVDATLTASRSFKPRQFH